MDSFSSLTKTRITQFQQDRLNLLKEVRFSDLFKSRSFLSGEITLASDFVYHRLDEYFDMISQPLLQKLIVDLSNQEESDNSRSEVIKRIGFYTYDTEFEEKWNQLLNLFIDEFTKKYLVKGKISWQNLNEPV